MFIRIYSFIFKKTKQNKTRLKNNNNKKQKQKQVDKKQKETKEETRISMENLTGHDHIICKLPLFIFNLLDRVVNFLWFFI